MQGCRHVHGACTRLLARTRKGLPDLRMMESHLMKESGNLKMMEDNPTKESSGPG
jgi:hypothetical protein